MGQDLAGGGHRVSLAGKLLGSEKFGGTRQFGSQGLRLVFEAVGVLLPTLHNRSLASLLEFHNLELETDGVVFQTGIDHR
ncbi:MAG: hypothetical protein JO248_05245 [Acidimicrobiia bacterium]|nr:hypothetical protein [Acidimicrobiia bacterium]